MAKLGLVAYLNTAPFRYGLRHSPRIEWIEEVPAKLLPLLQSGDIDAAILPVFDVLSHPELQALPGTCIASDGPAWSVKLFSRLPLRFVTTLALDTSSHTSAALTRVVMDQHGAHPAFMDLAPDLPVMLARADAALLIGDPCLLARPGHGVLVTDLGEEWQRLTGLPFVFAIWAARPGADCQELAAAIGEVATLGLADLDRVAGEEAGHAGLGPQEMGQYLRDAMRYHLDEGPLAGLERFRQLLVAQQLIAESGPVRFADR